MKMRKSINLINKIYKNNRILDSEQRIIYKRDKEDNRI